jgi:response regulator RpfG family c-di-GMP phosphodiesterase
VLFNFFWGYNIAIQGLEKRMVLFEDEKIEFFEEVEDELNSLGFWNILIVDDEKIVHESTKMVLNDFVFQNKKINFLCAYSAKEAKELLRENDDIAVVLLDVVMEKDNSGLELVKFIRDDLGNKFIRIILRTGQPGQAPEEDVVINYDINDYKMKTELTLQKLLTTVVSALRSYSNIMDLEINRRGLEDIIKIENDLYEVHHLKLFAKLLLHRVKALYDLGDDSCYIRCQYTENATKIYTVVAGTGRYESLIGEKLPSDLRQEILPILDEAKRKNVSVNTGTEFISYYKSIDIIENYIYFTGMENLDTTQTNLFGVLISNLSVAVDNIALNDKLLHTQSELINRLSEVIEVRSEETASHVGRVSKIAYLMAKYYGLDEEEALLLRTVAPLHDVGKIGIPESILNKPGKLTEEEFEVMKGHAMIGYRILRGSGLELLEAGALIAKEHHEYWNGKGYPEGKSGEDIHIYGRITLIADVFDALSHDRVYKKAWPFEEVIDYMVNQSGHMFDPKLIEILLEHKEEVRNFYKNGS